MAHAHDDLAPLSLPTLQALCAAIALANTLGLHADDIEGATPAERQARAELLVEDLRDCGAALAEAARLLSIDDPLGCVDSSEAHAELAEARAVYHAALAALSVDPLALAAA
jgi:hypothetical protein